MTKILATLRSILKSLTTKAKISVFVALSIPGLLKIEVSYARDLTAPRAGLPFPVFVLYEYRGPKEIMNANT